jgi:hypothetical protein
MNDLLELTSRIHETSAAISRHQRAMVDHPTPSLEASLRSLQKRMQKLQADLATLDPDHPELRTSSENGVACHPTTAKPAT